MFLSAADGAKVNRIQTGKFAGIQGGVNIEGAQGGRLRDTVNVYAAAVFLAIEGEHDLMPAVVEEF